MKDSIIDALMIKAQRAIKSAEKQLQDGDADFSASRIYYGIILVV
jgi:uncharacterized protein (UPF0332 family)